MGKSRKPANIKQMLEINVADENKFTFQNYIGECKSELYNILTDDVSYNLYAKMNSGKSTSVALAAIDNEINLLLLMPLRTNVKQLEADIKEKRPDANIFAIYGGTKDEDDRGKEKGVSVAKIQQFLRKGKASLIIAVYDSLSKLKDCNNFNSKDYVLVVDECHNLVSQYNFRYEAIRNIVEKRGSFRKVIYMSGTPEGTIYFNNHKTVLFSKISPESTVKMKIVPYKGNRSNEIFDLILNYQGNGKIIVLKDDVEFLKSLRSAFRKKLKSNASVTVLTSKNKNIEDYEYLVSEKKITQHTKIVLTTRVISDGVNIYNEDIDLLCIWDSNDFWMKRQFISRFRKGIKKVYEFVLDEGNTTENIFDIKKQFDEQHKSHKAVRRAKLREISSNDKIGQKTSMSALKGPSILYKRSKDIQISKEGIAYGIMNTINKSLYANPEFARQFYQDLAGYEVESASLEVLLHEKTINKNAFNRLKNGINTINSWEEFNNYKLEELFTKYLLFIHNDLSFFSRNWTDKSLIDSSFLSYSSEKKVVKENKIPDEFSLGEKNQILVNSSSDGKEILELNKKILEPFEKAEYGYPKEFLQLLININLKHLDSSVKSILKQIEVFYAYKIVREYPEWLKFCDSTEGGELYKGISRISDYISTEYEKYIENKKANINAGKNPKTRNKFRVSTKELRDIVNQMVSKGNTDFSKKDYKQILSGMYIIIRGNTTYITIKDNNPVTLSDILHELSDTSKEPTTSFSSTTWNHLEGVYLQILHNQIASLISNCNEDDRNNLQRLLNKVEEKMLVKTPEPIKVSVKRIMNKVGKMIMLNTL